MKKILASLLALAMIATLVPFAAFAEETVDTSFVFGSTYGKYNTNSVPRRFIGGIGGKAIDDTALAFVYEADGILTTNCRWEYPITHITDDFTTSASNNKGIYFAFNIYADGGVIARVGNNASGDVFKWYEDGRLVITRHGDSALTISMERGKWHKIGLSYNEGDGGRYALYVDGKLVTGNAGGWQAFSNRGSLYFGIEKDSEKGMVAYDDSSYQTWYDASSKYSKTVLPNDVVVPGASRYFDFEDDGSISAKKYISDIKTYGATLADAITNESEIRLLAEDMKTEATTFDEVKYVLVKTITNAYAYYTFNEYTKTDIDLIGLEVAENTSTSSDNWISNIVILDNTKVAVYSSELRNLSTVSSARLIEQGLISTTGYTLSYVNKDKNPATSNSVQDGYIKASKEGEDDIYIEIVNKYNVRGPMELTDCTVDKRGSTLTSATGVAGKSSGDVSHGFAGTTYTGSTASQKEAKYYLSEPKEDVISTHLDGTRTYVFNMYVDGDAIARLGMMHGTGAYYTCQWKGESGDFYAHATGTSMSSTPDLNLATGRWHQVAITMDRGTGGKLELYIDGKLLQRIVDEDLGWNNYTGIALATYCESTSGKVLYDDIEVYNGFYDAEASNVAVKSSSDDFIVDTDNKVIYYQNMTTSHEIATAALANTNATSAKVFADNTFTAEASELDNGANVVMLTSPDGIRYEYYTLKPISELPAPVITITPSKTTFTVSGKIISDLSGYTMYVATYTNDDTLVSVAPVVIDGSMLYKEFSNKYAFGSGGVKAKVFLWKADQTPLTFAQADALAE